MGSALRFQSDLLIHAGLEFVGLPRFHSPLLYLCAGVLIMPLCICSGKLGSGSPTLLLQARAHGFQTKFAALHGLNSPQFDGDI